MGILVVPLAVAYISLGGGFALILLGVIWYPFAGSICSNIAHNKGADVPRWREQGTKASCHQFLPWFYIVSLMKGKPLPSK